MAVYRPYGKEMAISEEEKQKRERIFEQYEYYGIPYLQIDDDKECETQEDLDKMEARVYIMRGEEVPTDLAEKLLKYK